MLEKEKQCGGCRPHRMTACAILGECMFDNSRTRASGHAMIKKLRKAGSFRDIVKVFEEIMPSLKRLGIRKYYKPEKFFEENPEEI